MADHRQPAIRLAAYNNDAFDRGASPLKEFAWRLVQRGVFDIEVLRAYGAKRTLLRAFGAHVGEGVVIKPGASVMFPWKLKVGADTWLGERCWLLNLAPITLGSNVCISQNAFVCTGNHDWASPTFDLSVNPIVIEDCAWIGANAFIGPGVTVHEGCVVTAGSIVSGDLPPWTICGGNPCLPLKPRELRHDAGRTTPRA